MNESSTPTLSADAGTGTASPQPAEVSSRGERVGMSASRLLTWGTKGGLAVVDQALFAGAQFLLSILLARWLAPAEYGAFAVAYSVFSLAAAFYVAVLLEPMVIFGSGRYLKNRKSYLGILLRGHWVLTVPAGLLVLACAFVLGRLYSTSVEHALFALGIALPLMLLMWLTRRSFYIELQPGWAAATGVVYFGGLLLLVIWLRSAGLLTPAMAIFAMGIAAVATSALQLARLRPHWSLARQQISVVAVTREHWQYGRWALASAAAIWMPLNLYYFVVPIWTGLKTAGELKAIMNLANPVLNSFIAFSLLIIPLLVRHRDQGGIGRVRRTVKSITVLFLLGSSLYLAVLWLFGARVIGLLYGGRYVELVGWPILLVGLIPVMASLTISTGSALRALERPDWLFWCYIASSGMTLAVGLPLASAYGLIGALLGLLLSYVVTAAAMCFFLWSRKTESLPGKEK